MNNSSIFNEVFGPVMVGPSSSHTAGPARIGKMCRQILPDEAAEIDISFDRQGSFAATYEAQGSNYGFIGGILGLDVGDEGIRRSLRLAVEKGVKFQFNIIDVKGEKHPNFAAVKITARNGFVLEAEAASTGGGMFEITRLQGCAVSLKGDCHEYLLFREEAESLAGAAYAPLADSGVGFEIRSSAGLLNIKTDQLCPDLEAALSKALGQTLLHLDPVLPVVKKMKAALPFVIAAEALEYARLENIAEPWRLAVAYESALSGQGEAEILKMMRSIAAVMRRSAGKGLEGGYRQRGFLPPQSPVMRQTLEKGQAPQINLGVLNKAALWSCAVLDYDICLGLVAAAPTGGSSGV
ncbi:MAG: hypothetical protein LBS31_00920, partial [Candidatus Adiutrix sp.]|nr:hypothetical protein [Candidatus Adiutrix sp.]